MAFLKAIIVNLVQECLVADVKEARGSFSIPFCALKSLADCPYLRLILEVATSDFRSPLVVLAKAREMSGPPALRTALSAEFLDGLVLISQDQIALHKILQLAQVPRPWVC